MKDFIRPEKNPSVIDTLTDLLEDAESEAMGYLYDAQQWAAAVKKRPEDPYGSAYGHLLRNAYLWKRKEHLAENLSVALEIVALTLAEHEDV